MKRLRWGGKIRRPGMGAAVTLVLVAATLFHVALWHQSGFSLAQTYDGGWLVFAGEPPDRMVLALPRWVSVLPLELARPQLTTTVSLGAFVVGPYFFLGIPWAVGLAASEGSEVNGVGTPSRTLRLELLGIIALIGVLILAWRCLADSGQHWALWVLIGSLQGLSAACLVRGCSVGLGGAFLRAFGLLLIQGALSYSLALPLPYVVAGLAGCLLLARIAFNQHLSVYRRTKNDAG